MPPTSSFTPDFDDPRTLGWGGRRQFSGSTIIFICLLALGVLWMAFAMLYGAHSKEIIWWWVCWLPLWAIGSGVFLWQYGMTHPPRVVCDVQGLTLYRRDRIVGQWHWQALQKVDFLTTQHLLAITPCAGHKCVYGDRHLSTADYADIVRAAQAFMQAPPVTPSLPGISRCWYKRSDTAYAAVSRISLVIAFTGILCYLLADGWKQSMKPKTLFDDEPAPYGLLLAIIAVIILLFLLHLIVRYYRYYLLGEAMLMAAIDGSGLTVYYPGGRSIRVPWADIRDIKAVQRHTQYGSTEYLLLTDRLGDTREINVEHLQDFAIAEEIVVAVNAVRHGMPLLPPGQNTRPGGIPRGAVVMFWMHVAVYGVLFLPFISGGIPLPEGTVFIVLILLAIMQAFPKVFFGWLDK